MNSAGDFQPGRLWSLWDIMINFQIFGICHHLRMLKEIEIDFEQRIAWSDAELKHAGYESLLKSGIPHQVSDLDCQRIDGALKFSIQLADQLELQSVYDRVDLFRRRLRGQLSIHDFFSEVRALRETFEQGLNFKYFYRYPQNKALVLLKFDGDWKLVNDKFPTAKEDALAAIDCWALGHHTASVFHLMRVAEIGLRALAREYRVKLPKKQVLEWADWQTIITGIKTKADALAIKKRGPKRDAALEFYRGALVSFEGFKDEFRNS